MLSRANRSTFGAAVLVLTAAPALGTEEEPWAGAFNVARVVAATRLELDDGRSVRLAGVGLPDDAPTARWAAVTRSALEDLVAGGPIRLATSAAPQDRYGATVAQIERADGLWLQGALLERGLVLVRTRPGEIARAEEMLELELTARAARRGIWADATLAPREADGRLPIGRFQIVRGRVRRVAPTERYVYLNFGAHWRTDFTLRARRDDLDGALVELDLEALADRRVEVRGVVLDAGGPLIELSHAEQLRVLR